MLAETSEIEEIIERVAALDIGKAELVCCVRVPHESRPGRRLQEVESYAPPRVRSARERVPQGVTTGRICEPLHDHDGYCMTTTDDKAASWVAKSENPQSL